MILNLLIPKLERHFPGRFSVAGAVVSFPAQHPEVGDVEVHDDVQELTVHAGNFTHIHFSNYDAALSKEQAADQVAEDALEFLMKLFADQIVMWGSHDRGGGCYDRETGSSSSFDRGQEFVWSGPIPRPR